MLDSQIKYLLQALCLAGLLLPPTLLAIGFQPLSIETLAQQADVIVQGKVLSKTCQQDPAGRIYTRIELAVADVWKGAVNGTPFLIVQGGGVLGERESVVAGQAQYAVGEEVVAFLVRNPRGEAITVGLLQGKFHIGFDPDSGLKLISSAFHGRREQAGVQLSKAPTSSDLLTVDVLKKRVLEVIR